MTIRQDHTKLLPTLVPYIWGSPVDTEGMEEQSMPGTCHVYLVSPVFWTLTPLCFFHSKHHVTLILIHKGYMFFQRVHSDLGKSQENQTPCSGLEV